jgi:N-acetylneuraminate synthase
MIKIEDKKIGGSNPTYFIADAAANHDGDLERAKHLCLLAKESGADAVKFQHFNANSFVSDTGFKSLSGKQSHQVNWKKSVYEVYADASLPLFWTKELKDYCNKIGITFFSSPYGLDMIEHLDEYVPAWKIGSGDVNYNVQLEAIAKTGKPVMLSTGASSLEEVINAVSVLEKHTDKIILMQCNTNYTGNDENFDYIHLNVLQTYKEMFPNVIIGLSDHTHGCVTVLGSVSLGARVIEKHFTDNIDRDGPDHTFSMTPKSWKEMVDNTRILERSLGHFTKEVQDNEKETVIVQRRALYTKQDIESGTRIEDSMLEAKRPCLTNSVNINHNFDNVITNKFIPKDTCIKWNDIE